MPEKKSGCPFKRSCSRRQTKKKKKIEENGLLRATGTINEVQQVWTRVVGLGHIPWYLTLSCWSLVIGRKAMQPSCHIPVSASARVEPQRGTAIFGSLPDNSHRHTFFSSYSTYVRNGKVPWSSTNTNHAGLGQITDADFGADEWTHFETHIIHTPVKINLILGSFKKSRVVNWSTVLFEPDFGIYAFTHLPRGRGGDHGLDLPDRQTKVAIHYYIRPSY